MVSFSFGLVSMVGGLARRAYKKREENILNVDKMCAPFPIGSSFGAHAKRRPSAMLRRSAATGLLRQRVGDHYCCDDDC